MRFLAFAMPNPTPWQGMGHVAGAVDLHKQDYARALLAWYDRDRRILPWRAAPGVAPDPYRVWLSEIMLQQTTVKAVLPRYADFLRRWPDVAALAAAELGAVLAAWAGLGYYARARNLHACAQAVVERHGGRFPATETELRTLPGIGDYTAAAIAAIAFGARATPIDGNIERVVARLFAVTTPLPAAKPEIRTLAAALTPEERAGDFAQSMMDLGATLCSPRRPACGLCPVVSGCEAHAQGLAEALPYREEKAERPTRRGVAFVALRDDDAVLLRERPLKGLLGGMLETPSSPWTGRGESGRSALGHAPLEAPWREVAGLVQHTFTHFRLELSVYFAEISGDTKLNAAAHPERCRWVPVRDLHEAALPSLMRKVLAHALEEKRARPRARVADAQPRARRRSA
jgi:A/G-specific adenine glycosylase